MLSAHFYDTWRTSQQSKCTILLNFLNKLKNIPCSWTKFVFWTSVPNSVWQTLVRLSETTKICTGQHKCRLYLSGGQPTITSNSNDNYKVNHTFWIITTSLYLHGFCMFFTLIKLFLVWQPCPHLYWFKHIDDINVFEVYFKIWHSMTK